MGMLIFFVVVVIWAVGSLAEVSDRAATALLGCLVYGLAILGLSLLFVALTGKLSAMLILPIAFAFALPTALVMRVLERERPPAS